MKRLTAISFLILAASGCSGLPQRDLDLAGFNLNCSGWLDGYSMAGSDRAQLGKSTYSTKLRWDAKNKKIFEANSEGELEYCKGIPGERCVVKLESNHLTGDASLSGPGDRPDILVRSTWYLDVDLNTMNAVKRMSASSGVISPDGRTATKTFEIAHEAQLSCARSYE